jgi:Ca2+-binding RTX toxin-like protein
MKPSLRELPAQVCIEALEPRKLFTGFAFHNHRLGIKGAGNFANNITVGLTPDQQSITATILVYTPKRTISYVGTFALSLGIRVVAIVGGNRDDLIAVDQTNGSFPIMCSMTGGAGYDTIIGGDEPDQMFGGPGNDLLIGGAGNDTLLGQTGDDTLIGGPGNDLLAGSFGNDDLVGGDGNDTLADARGADTVFGGAGNNLFSIRSFRLDHENDFNPATDKVHYVTVASNGSSGDPSLISSLFPIYSVL